MMSKAISIELLWDKMMGGGSSGVRGYEKVMQYIKYAFGESYKIKTLIKISYGEKRKQCDGFTVSNNKHF